MSRFHSYLTSAKNIIEQYNAGTPLNLQLKSFFQTDKKFGSRDRKSISALCYHYFRSARVMSESLSIEQKILQATFLCEIKSNELLSALAPELNELIDFDIKDKLEFLEIDINSIFAFDAFLSSDIDGKKYALSFFTQPDLFLRIRPGRHDRVISALQQAGINYALTDENVLRLENGVSVENILQINKDVVVQDLNSQHVFDYFAKEREKEKQETLWDCCAASGGKSISLFDICKGKIKITVSDIRENILANLQMRFKDAGINLQKKFVQDLSKGSGLLLNESFSIVVCDAPCSGSGTWARTPEQYHAFDQNKIDLFAQQQKNIVINAIKHVSKDGWFIYITCSVFREENEGVVDFIQQNFSLQLLEMKYLKGYDKKADTMFVAYFKS
jgi:16S rRNA (cytosine967-C5)-methyltransferase